MLNNPPVYAQSHTFVICLRSQANSTSAQVNPTLAAGDFKRSIDGGALANFDNLPTVSPAGGPFVVCVLSVAEMTAQNFAWRASDVAGAEWMDSWGNVQPGGGAGVLEYGTAQGGGAATLTLRSAASYADNILAGLTLVLYSGTGAGQSRQIASNVGATDVVTVDPAWTTAPDNTTVYGLFFTPPGAPLGAASFSAGALGAINGAILDGFIAWLKAGVTIPPAAGNMAMTNSIGGAETVAVTTNAAAENLVSFT